MFRASSACYDKLIVGRLAAKEVLSTHRNDIGERQKSKRLVVNEPLKVKD